MVSSLDVIADTNLRDEVLSAALGDSRRTERFADVVAKFAVDPSASVPVAMGDEAGREGYYRLMRNEAIDHFDLIAPHLDRTAQRSEALDVVVVAHDTTTFAFDVRDGEVTREHLARLSSRRQGFLWHASLALSADGLRTPLGLIHSRPFVHDNDEIDSEARAFWDDCGGIYQNEQDRWFESVAAAEERLASVHKVVHVMDREGDDFRTLVGMEACGYHFVIRMLKDRNVCDGPRRADKRKLREALDEVSWSEQTRSVELSARSKSQAGPNHPVRRAREAKLKVRATTVEVRRPDNVKAALSPNRLEVHVVEVLEVEPPQDQEPVHWLLVTDQPIDDEEAIWQIVDWYRARWVIEEYFKAIKTGTAYKKVQHKQARTLLSALATKAIVAWDLLVLRHLGRHAPKQPAEDVLNPVQIKVLRGLKPKLVPKEPTVADAMAAVAGLGGHIKYNGPPGWLVLGRGWRKMLEVEKGFRLAMAGHEDL